MISANELAVWLRAADTEQRVSALADFVCSGDLMITPSPDSDDAFGVAPAHHNAATRFEIGRAPILPACSA
jgi:hypothetical protein